MPIELKRLGYTLGPGERFTDANGDNEVKEESGRDGTNEKSIDQSERDILAKVAEIALKPVKGDSKVPWIETLDVVGSEACDSTIDRNQTIQMESHFKEIASKCVVNALKRLKSLGKPLTRQPDFFSDMLKSDAQMSKVEQRMAKQHDSFTRRREKHKKNLSKRVKERQNKNEFIKKINQLRAHRGKEPVEKQVDKICNEK